MTLFHHDDVYFADIAPIVALALREDIGDGDITGELIDPDKKMTAYILGREEAICCGQTWVDAVFKAVDDRLSIDWKVSEGSACTANQIWVEISGSARSILTAERCALNFLQTLSGTATLSAQYAQKIAHTPVQILDTRKTLPGLRLAQKYAIKVGGCFNHRLGLYHAFLIKENHIAACGGIQAAIELAKKLQPEKIIEVEVENLTELHEAIKAKSDIIMLDNFSLAEIRQAVSLCQGQAKLEVSGGVTEANLVELASTGIDYISIGALTKNIKAIDLSLRFYSD